MSDTHSTGPGDQSPKEIEREVDRERQKISGTVDELQERFSPKNLASDAMSLFSEHGGDFGRSLGRTVRDNPVPLILTGIGLAWLMAGSGDQGRSSRREFGHDDGLDYGRDRYRQTGWYDRDRLPDHDRTGRTAAARTGAAGGDDGGVGSSLRSGAPGVGSDIGSAARSVGASASDTTSTVRDKASAGVDAAADAARTTAAKAGALADRTGAAAADTYDEMRRRADDAGRRARDYGRRARDGLDDLMEEQPLVIGALALAIGAAIGGALPRTQREDEWVGEESDRLYDEARSTVLDEAAKARAVGERVADEASEMADEVAAKVSDATPQGSEAVSAAEREARAAGNRLTEAAKDEAEKQGLGDGKSPEPKT